VCAARVPDKTREINDLTSLKPSLISYYPILDPFISIYSPLILTSDSRWRILVLPYMASLIAKKKGNQLYYYVVESARVDGQPRIVHQSYLGSAERVSALVRDRTAPIPLSATLRDFGLPGALWLAALQTGVFDLLQQLWPAPRSGPSAAHYLLLAAIHRICQPGPKTEVADWYDRTILQPLWGFAPERFTSQAFWDCFEVLSPERPAVGASDELEQAQLRLIGLWKQRQMPAAACWPTIPPTFTPISPAPTRRTTWRNAATISRGDTTYAK